MPSPDILPAEAFKSLHPLTPLQTAVVSIPHPRFGSQPLAVLNTLNGKSPTEIEDHVRRTLGDDYAPGGLMTLRQIGMEKFPVNATYKIVKQEVQRAVLQSLRETRLTNGTT